MGVLTFKLFLYLIGAAFFLSLFTLRDKKFALKADKEKIFIFITIAIVLGFISMIWGPKILDRCYQMRYMIEEKSKTRIYEFEDSYGSPYMGIAERTTKNMKEGYNYKFSCGGFIDEFFWCEESQFTVKIASDYPISNEGILIIYEAVTDQLKERKTLEDWLKYMFEPEKAKIIKIRVVVKKEFHIYRGDRIKVEK